MNSKKVYIVILNYNGWNDTIECLESVLKNDYSNYQVIVVDNSSPDNSMEYIVNWAEGKQEVKYDENSQLKYLSQPFESKPLKYIYYTKEEALRGEDEESELMLNNPLVFIQAGENNGYAAGNNIGIEFVLKKTVNDDDLVWILNNDSVVEHDMITKVVNTFSLKEKIDLIGCATYKYFSPDELEYSGSVHKLFYGPTKVKKIFNKMARFDYVVGNSMFIPVKIFRLKLIPEDYFLYYEEIAFVEEVKKLGFNNIYSYNNAKVYHKESGSIVKSSPLQIYYSRRNKLYFMYKYRSIFEFIIFLFLNTITTIKNAITYKINNDKSKYKAIVNAYIDFFMLKRDKRW